MIGHTLDRYRIESTLGEGGMGVVYLARDTQLDRSVALKVLPSDKVADAARKQRFVQEAKAASALNHPGIVAVFDIRSDAGVDFIVMEHVKGRTLEEVMRSRRLGVQTALRYAAAIADAVAAAHQAGILHRDLKPSNVMVTDEDRIKILDFGLAKLADASDGAGTPTRTTLRTDEGIVLGTAAYMSPEQAEGRPLDGRSDIFSLGAVLYEMVTGTRPFIADSPLAVLGKIVNEEPPPPSRIELSVPTDVERAVLRCLRKDPGRRFQTMADLKVALDDLLADSAAGVSVPAGAGRGPRRWPWAAATLVVVGIVATYAFWPARQPSDTEAPHLQAVPLTSTPGSKRSPSFSADANQVAFSWTGLQQDNSDIYVQQIGAGSPLRLTTDAAEDYGPQWAPDGRSIAFLRRLPDGDRHDVRLIPPLGGPERKLTEVVLRRSTLRSASLAWCPDSRCLVVADSTGPAGADALFVITVESGEKRQLTSPPQSGFADSDPAISPDGTWLVFRRDSAPFTGELYRQTFSTTLTDPVRLTPTQLAAYNPRWMSDGEEIVFSARGGLWRQAVAGDATARRLPFVGEDGLMPAVAGGRPGQPSRLIYVRSFADTNVWRVETSAPGQPAATAPVVAIASTRRDGTAHFSANGRQATFTSNRTGESEIWIADAAGTNAVQLTSMAANPGFSRWSPDGESVVFHSNAEGQPEVFLVRVNGGRPRNLTAHAAVDNFPSFSRDGLWVYFSSTRGGTPTIWKLPTAGGSAVQVAQVDGLLAVESTDGADLYFVQSAATDRPGPLMRMPVGGGTPVKVADDVIATAFDVIAGGSYYLERVADVTRLRYLDFTSRRSSIVAENLGNLAFGLTATPDGRTILFSRIDSSVDDLMLVENFR